MCSQNHSRSYLSYTGHFIKRSFTAIFFKPKKNVQLWNETHRCPFVLQTEIILPLMKQNPVAAWKISLLHSYVCNEWNVICFEFLANSSLAYAVVGNQVWSRCGERTLHLHQYQFSKVSLGIAVAWRRKKLMHLLKVHYFFNSRYRSCPQILLSVSKPPGWVFVIMVALCIHFMYSNILKWMQNQMLLC